LRPPYTGGSPREGCLGGAIRTDAARHAWAITIGGHHIRLTQRLHAERVLDRTLTGRAHEPTILPTLEAHPAEEFFTDRRVMAIAHGRDHMPAIVAQVLDGPAARDIPLIGHQAEEDHDEDPENCAHNDAREGALLEGGQWQTGHAESSFKTNLKLGGSKGNALSGNHHPHGCAPRGRSGRTAPPWNPNEPSPRAALPD